MATSLALKRSLLATPRWVASSKMSFSALVDLESEFPGMPHSSPQPAKASTGSVSELPNGVTVVTEDACTSATVAITYPKAGSASELINEQGAAFLNKCLAFNSGSDMSTLYINRMIENAGAKPFVYGDRAGVSLGFTVTPDKVADLLKYLVVGRSFEKWDVRDARKQAETEAMVANSSAQIVLTETLNAAAYGPQSPAGRPFYSNGVSLDALTSFHDRAYGLSGAILTATGVKDHSSFCSAVTDAFSDASPGGKETQAKLDYLGGESRIAAPSTGYAHVAMGFKAPESMYVKAVVKSAITLMGKESGITGFSAFGLLGAYGGSVDGSDVVDAMTKVVQNELSNEIIARAKTAAKAEALFALDGGSQLLAQYMTDSVHYTGGFSGPSDIAKSFDSVSEDEVKSAMSAMLKSNLSLAAVGDISLVPYHATVSSRF